MKIEYSPRGAGKTERLISWLREDEHRLMIVVSNNEENRLKRAYPDVKNQIVDWESYKRAHSSSYFKEVGIDNADLILQSQVREPLNIISLTSEE